MSRDWDCGRDGHVPASAGRDNFGLAKGTTKVTWCLMCGRRIRKK